MLKQMKSRVAKHIVIGIAIGICAIILTVVLSKFELFDTLELKSLDAKFRLRGAKTPTSDIVIVNIDDESFNELGVFPWPRNFHSKVIDNLKKSGTKVIALDIDFSTPGAFGEKIDSEFANSIKKAGNVILVSTFTVINDSKFSYETPNFPIPVLKNAVADYGFSKYDMDKDSYIRHSKLKINHQNEIHYAFPIAILSKFLGVEKSNIVKNIGSDEMFVNFCGVARTFKNISYHRVCNSEEFAKLPRDFFKDKIVMIGATAEVLHDIFPTSFGSMPGVEIHANTIDTILKGEYITKTGRFLDYIILIALTLLVSSIAVKFSPLKSLSAFLFLIVLLWVISFYSFFSYRICINSMEPFAGMFFAYVGNTIYSVIVEGKEKRKIKHMFSRYVSHNVVNELLRSPEKLSLGGKREKVTVLFSDIRNFSTMSEKMTPEQVVAMLNEYFTEMVNVVLKYDGTVDKFIGDAIMAVFGAPIKHNDDAKRACLTALEMREALARLRTKWQTEGKDFLVDNGIGINTGEVVVGNIGSAIKMEYTVIGDNVNIASRLEGLTKNLKAPVLISQSVYDEVKDIFEVKAHGKHPLKGRAELVEIYEILKVKEG